MTASAFYTIGHSTRTIDEFVALLKTGGVQEVVDVRAMPRSRTNPQFNHEALTDSLAPAGIAYRPIAALAGLRRRPKNVPDDINGYWRNRSFHNYADYALSEAFQAGLTALIEAGRRSTCAVMCAETVWWRCHRRIIADHLLHSGEIVYHLMGSERIQTATLTPGACTSDHGQLIYPANAPVP